MADLRDQKLELFYRPTCPFCQKVLAYIDAHHIEGIALRNVEADPANLEHLQEVTGRSQVPCLFIDGKPLFESDDIISFLQKYFA